jgi:hypothetical protein
MIKIDFAFIPEGVASTVIENIAIQTPRRDSSVIMVIIRTMIHNAVRECCRNLLLNQQYGIAILPALIKSTSGIV